ncbi:MAG: hypothetical protein ACRDP1_16045 [Nocardioidaceae bacterium]
MDEATKSVGPLAVLGLGWDEERVYRVVLRHSGDRVNDLTDTRGRPLRDLGAVLDRLEAAGLITLDRGVVTAVEPELALGKMLQDEVLAMRHRQDQLAAARMAIPEFMTELRAGQLSMSAPSWVDLVPMEEAVGIIMALASSTEGEMLFLRPDQWSSGFSPEIDAAVVDALNTGRPSRALCPMQAIERNGYAIRHRINAGEVVRVLADVPSRLVIFGPEVAVMTEQWGAPGGHRLVIRHRGLIDALIALFESLWMRATAIPGLGQDLTDDRRALLELLGSGAIDEQIARSMGLSLRTVRRRVSELMAELGAVSRFQVGVEAVHRGWL